MKKQISEEINSMKFLLNYKRGVVISEQTDMSIISTLSEQEFSEDTTTGLGYNDALLNNKTTDVNTTSPEYVPPIDYDIKKYMENRKQENGNDWSKYLCVTKHPNAKKGKTPKGSEFYQIGNYNYYNNGRKWNIVMRIAQNYTCNDPEFKTNQIKKLIPIPPELKNIEGVKLFQDWLDINHAGWATGFPNGKLNKGAGYGNFGPRTQKAWTLYGKEYLQSLNVPIEDEKESPWMKSQLEKIKSEKPNPAFTAPIQKVGTPLQSAQNPAPVVNQGVSQIKPQ
jgi:hypothetical protein